MRKAYMSAVWPAVVAAYLLFGCSNAGQAETLAHIAQGLKLDPNSLSVSGMSAGAFMATQLQVSYSSRIKGVGVIAGGPYRCAEGRYPGNWLDISGFYTMSQVCTKALPSAVLAPNPNVNFSITETERLAKEQAIDPPANLQNTRVWLFSGGKDTTVPTSVMDTVLAYYQHYVPAERIQYVKNPQANHAMITDNQGQSCGAYGEPFINDCDFDAAGALFQHIYGALKSKVKAVGQNLQTFNQQTFFAATDDSVSMHANGHIYVPTSCRQGNPCRLHIALHGCMQSEDFIGAAFYTESDYNEWAESNRIVVLYPQARKWSGLGLLALARNPQGCWDWWGYSGENYAEQSGKQIQAINAMINTLLQLPQ